MRVGLYHERAGDRDAGGIAVYVRKMAIALGRSHRTYLYTTSDGAPGARSLRRAPVTVVRVPRSRGRPALARATPLGEQHAAKLAMFYRILGDGHVDHIDENVDVLLTAQFLDDLLVSNVVRPPTVFQFHGFQRAGPGIRATKWLSRTSRHLANSHSTARRVQRRLGLPIDGIVRPGVDVDRFTPEAEPAFDHDRPTVVFVGRIVEAKGAFDLLEAFEGLAGDARLRVVGRGDLDRARRLADGLGLRDDVVFEGEVRHDRLPGYYTAAEVFCLPSHYESFGMANLEAMACGTPVVTTTVGGTDEYATHGETALLVPPGDVEHLRGTLDALLDSPRLRERLGAAGRAEARAHSWERRAETLGATLERITGGR